MSLLEALKNKPDAPEPRTRIAAILLKLDHEEQAALETALRDPAWTNEGLADLLTASGHPVSEASVRRYRKALSK